MVNLLPDDVFVPDAKFLDINCKTGVFLIKIFNRLDKALSKLPEFEDNQKRITHILNNQLYALAADEGITCLMASRNVWGTPFSDNIQYIGNNTMNYPTILKCGRDDIIKQNLYTMLFGESEPIKERNLNKVRFDVVVGNPPYNNDIYLPFVTLGDQLASKYTLMITPAKWQAKGGKANEEFRKNIVPRMSHIVYYPESTEIFSIAEPAGITYYLIDKQINYRKNIVNRCDRQLLFDNERQRAIGLHLNNMANEVLCNIKSKISNTIKVNPSRAYFINSEQSNLLSQTQSVGDVVVFGGGSKAEKILMGYCSNNIVNNKQDINKYKMCMHFKTGFGYGTLYKNGMATGIKPMNILNPREICKNDFMILFTSNNLSDVESYISYFDTKFIRFLTYCGCCGSNASNSETWRFVPDPGAFDHIFTDEELYKKYELTQDEISLIESVIKERK